MRRLEFAIKYRNFDWTKVLFHDETSYWMNNDQVKRWYNNENIYDKDIVYKHPAKINIWGAITYKNKIIDTFTENMDTTKYLDLLETKMIKIYEKDYYILGDNDPKHNSIKSKKYLKDKAIKCVDFPPHSPDLNPIENMWAILKMNMRKDSIKNINDLRETALFTGDKISMDHIRNTIDSMKSRLQKVIDAKGSYIN